MDWLTQALSNNTLHQAYGIQSSDSRTAPLILDVLGAESNTATHHHLFESFGVDDARALAFLMIQASEFPRNVHIISYDSISLEAQNALLKAFEEPAKGIHVILLSSAIEQLLPTLRSRLQIYTITTHDLPAKIDAAKFLSASPHKRLDLIAKTLAKKDFFSRPDALYFLDELEELIAHEEGDKHVAREIYAMKELLRIPSSSIKYCLDHIALVI